MKVSELSGAELDYWVAKAQGLKPFFLEDDCCVLVGVKSSTDPADDTTEPASYAPSVAWEDGGPIIERERIQIVPWAVPGEDWEAKFYIGPANEEITAWGKSALEAAMRCFVASKFGEEVPDADKA